MSNQAPKEMVPICIVFCDGRQTETCLVEKGSCADFNAKRRRLIITDQMRRTVVDVVGVLGYFRTTPN